jgi:hypothetical protein
LNLARQVEQTAEAATQAQERLAAQRQAQRVLPAKLRELRAAVR